MNEMAVHRSQMPVWLYCFGETIFVSLRLCFLILKMGLMNARVPFKAGHFV